MQRCDVNAVEQAFFHNSPRVHHQDTVRQTSKDAGIMGNHNQSDTNAPLELSEKGKNFLLSGGVEGSRGFVSNDQCGPASDRLGNEHALSLASAQLVGKGRADA